MPRAKVRPRSPERFSDTNANLVHYDTPKKGTISYLLMNRVDPQVAPTANKRSFSSTFWPFASRPSSFGCGRSCLLFLRPSLLRVLVAIAAMWKSCVATASQFC